MKLKVNVVYDDSVLWPAPIKFAWANYNRELDEATRITHWYECRDYLGDNLWDMRYRHKTNTSSNVGGSLMPTACLETEYSCLAMSFTNGALLYTLKKQLTILNQIEKVNGFIPSRIKQSNNPKVIIVGGDIRWTKNTFLCSIWSYFLKILCQPIPLNSTWHENLLRDRFKEADYYRDVKDVFHEVLKDLNSIVEHCPTISGFLNNDKYDYHNHNQTGFVYNLKWRGHERSMNKNTLCKYLTERYGPSPVTSEGRL